MSGVVFWERRIGEAGGMGGLEGWVWNKGGGLEGGGGGGYLDD